MLQILSKNCLHTLRRAHFTSPVSFISIWPLKVCHFALYKQKGLMGHPVFSTLSSLTNTETERQCQLNFRVESSWLSPHSCKIIIFCFLIFCLVGWTTPDDSRRGRVILLRGGPQHIGRRPLRRDSRPCSGKLECSPNILCIRLA